MKPVIHALDATRDALKRQDTPTMFKMLARVSRIFEQLTINGMC